MAVHARLAHPADLRRQALTTKVVPLSDHIILKPVESEEITSSGLVIPESAKEKPQHGEVLAVGPGRMNEAGIIESSELDAGDRVLYQKYTGQEVTVDQEDYLIIRFQDVLAKLEEESAGSRRRR